MSDVIKSFRNEVILAGKLAELDEPRYGTDKNGRKYVSVRGAIQCVEEAVYLRRFESYINATKKDGTDSKLYERMTSWLEDAVPMTKDKENATMVELRGSIQDKPYVSSKEELVEGVRYSMQFINDFTEYKCDVNLEGYVKEPFAEIVDEKETGRMKTEIISTDSFRNVIHIKNIIIPEDMVEGFNESGYEDGNVTGTLFLSYLPTEVKEAPVNNGGFGKQRTTDGKNHLELVLIGGEPSVELADDDEDDNPKVVTKAMVKRMNVARKNRLQEIKDAGYQGSKSDSSRKSGFSKSSSKTSSAKTSSKAKKVEEEDEDDMPF